MRIADLGHWDGAVLAFGGPYSNRHALDGLLDAAKRLGIAQDRMICTGDVVAYCADAAASVDIMQQSGIACVAGNCEQQLAAGALDCGCGFDAGTTCDLLSAGWYAHANAACGAQHRAWMAACPDVALFTHAGRRVAVIHGGVTDVARFVWPNADDAVFAEEIAALTARTGAVDMVIAGHCGVPFDRRIGPVRWLNAGAIGMPAHDGQPTTHYAVLGADGTATIKTLRYDTEAAAQAMEQAGLTQGYHTALRTGWWPSQDVLPTAYHKPR